MRTPTPMRTRFQNLRSTRWSAVPAAILTMSLATPLAAQPVLEVRINDTVIASGSTHEFEDTVFGSSTPLIVVLRNIGNENLTFENPPVALATGFPDSFTVIQAPLEAGNQLSPNGSTAFRVDFVPSLVSPIVFTAQVSVATNAAAQVFTLNLAGRVLGPQMAVTLGGEDLADGGTVVFDDTTVQQTRSLSFVIENRGQANLILTGNPALVLGGPDATSFEVTQEPAITTIPAGQSTSFVVQFSPLAEGTASATLAMAVNEISTAIPDGVFNLNLQGEGVVPPVDDDDDDNNNDDDDGKVNGRFSCGSGMPFAMASLLTVLSATKVRGTSRRRRP